MPSLFSLQASYAGTDGLQVDVAFGDRLPALAEKFRNFYEAAPTDKALFAVRYFVGQLLPALAESFERRLSTVEIPGEDQVTFKGALDYRARWNGYALETNRTIPVKK